MLGGLTQAFHEIPRLIRDLYSHLRSLTNNTHLTLILCNFTEKIIIILSFISFALPTTGIVRT